MIAYTVVWWFYRTFLFPIDSQFISVAMHPWGSRDEIGTSVHSASAPHPPLLIEHEYLQYGRPVVLHMSHSDPLGHG